MKFIKEEISLCKQVAKKHRKGIKYGDWYWHEIDEDVFLHSTKEKYPYVAEQTELPYIIPLWTISDCLEFLREKGWWARIDFGIEDTRIYTFHKDLPSKHWTEYPMYKGKTPLEACLKAVLAVLEEKDE